jgi:high-affinity iron transporter
VLPTLVIFFRESLEASLIVAIILAYLQRVGRRDGTAAVWLGVAGALAVDVAAALLTYHVIRSYDGSRVQTVLEGSTYLVATALLTSMSFWMKGQSRGLRRELEARVQAALTRGSLLALVLLAAVTVGREGLETVFFTLAIAFTSSPAALLAGAGLGLLAGLGVSHWVYRLGRRAPVGLFFNVLGVLLLLFAAGLLADGVQDFQALGWLPFLTQVVWQSQHLLSEQSALGDILHSFFGYADRPTVLQLGAYLAFLLGAVGAYVRLGRRGPAAGAGRPAEGR